MSEHFSPAKYEGVCVVGRRSALPADSPLAAEPHCSFVALATADGRPIRGTRCGDYLTGVGHFERATAEAHRLQVANPTLRVRAFYGVSIEGAEEQVAARPSSGPSSVQASC